MTIEDLAKQIGDEVMPENVYGFDPALIAAIISILMQLWPMLQDCGADDTESIQRFASLRPGWRVRRWRLQRIVRQELGPDALPSLVQDVANAIVLAAENDDACKALMR